MEATAARIGVITEHIQLLRQVEAERRKREQQAEEAIYWETVGVALPVLSISGLGCATGSPFVASTVCSESNGESCAARSAWSMFHRSLLIPAIHYPTTTLHPW
jgi:hypothetical protein